MKFNRSNELLHRLRRGFSLLIGAVLLIGCAQTPPASSYSSDSASSQTSSAAGQADSKSVEITDDLGRTVRLSRPQRVAILLGSFADAYCEAGGRQQIVAAAHDSWTSFDLNLEGVSDLGDVKSIAQETLLASRPDLVIASAKNDSQKKMKDILDAAGIPVVYFDVSSFEDYLKTLERMTELTGDSKAYQSAGTAVAGQIEAVRNRTHEPALKVLALRETGKGITALGSEDSVLGEMLSDLGCINIAGASGQKEISAETVHLENPDVILYVAQGKTLEQARTMADQLFEQESWSSLEAVRNGQVHVLDQTLYNLKPNARWGQALESLESLLYGS